MNRIRSLALQCMSLVGLVLPQLSYAQLTVDNTTMTPEQLVTNVLLGGGVTVSNVTFNAGAATTVNEQAGFFDASAANVGLQSGVILGSGNVTVAIGPNNSPSQSLGGSGQMGVDPDLAAITPNQIFDEAVLEFDFVPAGDTIRFRYVFASEEYDEYVCGTVNDAFGFFLSGPNPAGGNYTAHNIALIPDPANPAVYTTTPVSINTVNNGTVGANGTQANCDNIDPNWPSYNVFYAGNTGTSVQYDGMTVILTAVAAVNCGEEYHIKLAIGDAGDGAFDSGVFLEEGSFSSESQVQITTVNADTVATEGCDDASFVFYRPDTSSAFTINYELLGTAVNGTDYLPVADSVVIPQGEFTDTLVISPILDGIVDPGETVTVAVVVEHPCDSTLTDTIQASITIEEYVPVVVNISGADTICPPEVSEVSAVISGGFGNVTYSWNQNLPQGLSHTVAPTNNTVYTISAIDECAGAATSASVEVAIVCPITIPNVFTPNGDGFNQHFVITFLEHHPNSHLTVYNRWGKKVYEDTDYQNDWDGTHFKNGNACAEGTYFYVLVMEDGEQHTGHLNLLK